MNEKAPLQVDSTMRSRAFLDFEVASVASSLSRLDAFVRSALRLRAREARRVLAHGLDPDTSLEELLASIRSSRGEDRVGGVDEHRSPLIDDEMRGAWWRALGRVVALQGLDETDGIDGVILHDIARALTPVRSWSPADALTYAQLLLIHGQTDRLRQDRELLAALTASDRQALEVDLAADADGLGSVSWNSALERILGHVPPVTVDAAARTPFDGLRPIRMPAPVDGPLVSVIMSAYCPGTEILTSVRSILDQSWTNLELLVVDDASGPEYAGMLDRVAELDPRVRVLVQPENRGTYSARNRALPETRGDFITFQDSDDWSHPERIARQARRLLDDTRLPAVMSHSIRCTPDMGLQLLGYHSTRPNASSLMLRRSTVDALGSFDHVRKGADTEYQARISAHYGRRVPVMPDPLAFVRLDPSSLSRSDFRPGWWHPARHAYRDAYQRWHSDISLGASARLSSSPEARAFPAPRTFLRATGHQLDNTPLDLLFLADWRELGRPQGALLHQARMAVADGRHVGIMHLETARALEHVSSSVCREISDLLHERRALQILPDDAVVVDRIVVGDPAVLSYASGRMPNVRVSEVVVVASSSPLDPAPGAQAYDPVSINRTIVSAWEVAPIWIPGSEHARTALGAIGVHVAPADLPAGFAWDAVPPHRTTGSRPIIGAVIGASEDGVLETAEQLLALLPDDQRFDVRLIAPPRRLAQLMGTVPHHWLVFRPDDIAQRDFYRQLDFFVSSEDIGRVDKVVPRVIEAVTAGAVAVLPPAFADVLGEAAVYADVEDMADTVGRLFVDPGEYAAVSARALASVSHQFPTRHVEQILSGPLESGGRRP